MSPPLSSPPSRVLAAFRHRCRCAGPLRAGCWRWAVAWLVGFSAAVAGASGVSRAADLRLGIVGLDTSHVGSFLQMFNDPRSPDHVPGARIVAAYKGGSPDVEASASRIEGYTRLAVRRYGVRLYPSIEELAANVDGILILSVDGRPHLDQFRHTLAARKPVFIDKPLAGSLADAVEIVRLSRAAHVPCFSTSSLRYTLDSPAHHLADAGEVASAFAFSPGDLEPHHPDLFWYGVHAVEALYTVLGPGCVSVARVHTRDTDVVTGVWADGRIGIIEANRRRTKPKYGTIVFGSKAMLVGGEQHSFKPLGEDLVRFFRTGQSPVPLDTTLEIYAFMAAADVSKQRDGAAVNLADVLRSAR